MKTKFNQHCRLTSFELSPRRRNWRSQVWFVHYGLVLTLAWLCTQPSALAQVAQDTLTLEIAKQQFVFEDAPFEQCHASAIVELPDGRLLAAFFAGTQERNPDVTIWIAEYDGGQWSEPRNIADGLQYTLPDGTQHRYACWNPVFYQARDGPLLLFYKCGPRAREWWGMVITSHDNGRTWDQPRRLPEGIFGPIRSKPVELPSGELLCPASTEDQGWQVHFEWTPDLGKTWYRTPPVDNPHNIDAIQPAVLVHDEGVLQALGRSAQQRVWQSWSFDHGRTWTPIELTEIENPNSAVDATTISSGHHVLVFNRSTQRRTPLSVAISDDGTEWTTLLDLEDRPGEYSYPSILETSRGEIHLTYTWRRQRIKHVVLRLTAEGTQPNWQRPQ